MDIINDAFLDDYVTKYFDELSNSLLLGGPGLSIYYAIKGNHGEAKQEIYNRFVAGFSKAISDAVPLTMNGGLLDTALSISYIVREVEKGNADDTLDEVDQMLYTKYCVSQNKIKQPKSNYIDALFYISHHMELDIKDKVKYHIFEKEIVGWIEYIYAMADQDAMFYKDPVAFNLTNSTILFLESMVCVYRQGIYHVRLEHIFNEVIYKLEKLPLLHSNRLQLLYVVEKMCLMVNNLRDEWFEYRNILRASISVDKMLNKEITKNQIFFADGLSGIYLLMILYNRLICSDYFEIDKELYVVRIRDSVFTKMIPTEVPCIGVGINGFWGIKLMLEYLRI